MNGLTWILLPLTWLVSLLGAGLVTGIVVFRRENAWLHGSEPAKITVLQHVLAAYYAGTMCCYKFLANGLVLTVRKVVQPIVTLAVFILALAALVAWQQIRIYLLHTERTHSVV